MTENEKIRAAVIAEVKALLLDEGIIGDKIETRQPTHGTCCTCQVCGFDYENCCCVSNTIIAKLDLLTPKEQS